MIDIAITNRQNNLSINADLLANACRKILAGDGHAAAAISLAVVDDAEMHDLNRAHLDHDYPTDVLSFPLSDPGAPLAGEVIVSADTAIKNAGEYGNLAEEELLLYVVHGLLHLVGLCDKSPRGLQEDASGRSVLVGRVRSAGRADARLVYIDDGVDTEQLASEGEPTR